jgi:flagellar basal-body rod protein FlgC
MISAIQTALSGLAAFTKQVEITGHNVANIDTEEFKKSNTELVSVETGGVLPVVRKDESSGPTVLSDGGHGAPIKELLNLDLGEETVNLILGQRGFEANLQTLNTADQMLGTILDIKR